MKHLFSLIIILLGMYSASNAQNSDTTSVAVVNVFKDERLDLLLKRPAAIKAQEAAANAANEANSLEKNKDAVPVYNTIKAGKKEISGSIIQKNGYRIQIYNGTDKNLAMTIKSQFIKQFPGFRSYMNYTPPNFKIKVGDFEDKKGAANLLKRIQAILPGAFIVPDVVTVKNIIIQ